METKRFEKKNLDRKDYRKMEVLASIVRIPLTPIFLLIRLYYWVWDFNYYERFKRN